MGLLKQGNTLLILIGKIMRILLDSCCPANEDGGGGFLNTGHDLECVNFPIDALTKLGKWDRQEYRTDTKKIKEIKDLLRE